jgi:hypothetical protein
MSEKIPLTDVESNSQENCFMALFRGKYFLKYCLSSIATATDLNYYSLMLRYKEHNE